MKGGTFIIVMGEGEANLTGLSSSVFYYCYWGRRSLSTLYSSITFVIFPLHYSSITRATFVRFQLHDSYVTFVHFPLHDSSITFVHFPLHNSLTASLLIHHTCLLCP